MESHDTVTTGTNPLAAQARAVLRELESDRAALADQMRAPRWLHPVLAAVVAGFVATPAIRSDDARTTVVGLLMAGAIGVVLTHRSATGVRVGRTGAQCGALLAGLLLTVLLLLSVSYGLVSSLSAWWVLAPATACFAVVLTGGRWFDRLYRENLRRGR